MAKQVRGEKLVKFAKSLDDKNKRTLKLLEELFSMDVSNLESHAFKIWKEQVDILKTKHILYYEIYEEFCTEFNLWGDV